VVYRAARLPNRINERVSWNDEPLAPDQRSQQLKLQLAQDNVFTCPGNFLSGWVQDLVANPQHFWAWIFSLPGRWRLATRRAFDRFRHGIRLIALHAKSREIGLPIWSEVIGR
jgi:hypothetical protein